MNPLPHRHCSHTNTHQKAVALGQAIDRFGRQRFQRIPACQQETDNAAYHRTDLDSIASLHQRSSVPALLARTWHRSGIKENSDLATVVPNRYAKRGDAGPSRRSDREGSESSSVHQSREPDSSGTKTTGAS
ncbi:MAG TPA: hypothetical protein VEY92_05940, partial [Pseudoxanthomonas sp.]|nr:hypothetical protein [Pseudoxanthomonas sp.]